MNRIHRCIGLVAVVALTASAAQAQVVRGWRGGGIVVRAPFVPQISVGLRGAIPGVPLVRPYILPRRRFLAAPPYGPQPPAPSEAPRYAPGARVATADSNGSTPALSWPTPTELAALDDSSLLNAVMDAMVQLDAEVATFDTGVTWQRYFRLPDDALPPPSADGHVTLGMKSIVATLQRLDSAAANGEYGMITSLPSFAAAQNALREVVTRFHKDPGAQNAAGSAEELPLPPAASAPALAPPEQSAGQERSILAR